MESPAKEAIRSHIAQQWPSHRITEEQWTKGSVSHVMPDLRILAAVPRKSGEPCIYVTCGASDIDVGATYGIEFFLYSRSFELRHVELLSMVTYMHRVPEHRFDVGHTMKIGWPWEDASACDRLLVSLPYSPGKRFEISIASRSLGALTWTALPMGTGGPDAAGDSVDARALMPDAPRTIA